MKNFSYKYLLKISVLLYFFCFLVGCKPSTSSPESDENLLANSPKEKTHVDSIITNTALPLTYLTETYSTQPTTKIDQEVIPVKTSNYLKATDTVFADLEIPDTIKNVKPQAVYLKPFISYVNHPSPTQAKELRSSPLANTDIQYLNVEQGLPNTNIHDIDEDKNGFLWLSHSSGLSRYDGYNFYNYTTKNGLPTNYIYSLVIDKKNNFWILCPQGLIYFNGIKFKTYNDKSGLLNDPINDMIIDDNNNLWILHKNEGVGKISNDTIYYYNKSNGLKKQELNAIGIDSLNRIFVSYYNELPSIINKNTILHYNLNKVGKKPYWYAMFTMFTYRDNKGYLWTSNYGGAMLKTAPNSRSQAFVMPTGFYYDVTTCMTHDKQDNYWFGTNDGGIICKKDTSYFSYTIKNGLTSNKINNIISDKQNNIWVATSTSGLVRIKQGGFNIYGSKEGFTNKLITSLTKDSKNNLLIGTAVDGLWIYNNKTFYKPTCIANQIIVTAIEDNKNRVLIYDGNGFNYELFRSNDSLHIYDQQKCIFHYPNLSYVLAAHKDQKNNLWLFKPTKGLCLRNNDTLKVYTTKTGLVAENIRAISSDSKGNVWIVNTNCGISKISKNTITHYTKKEGLQTNNSNIIFCDSYDRVWIGSNLGINLFNGNKFTSFETSDGLTSNFVMSIVEDVNKNIWVGTTNGLNQLIIDKKEPKGFKITNFYTQDGLRSVSFNRNAAVSKGDELYWGTSEGLLSLNVSKVQNKTLAPNAVLSDIDILEHTINYHGILDSIKLSKPYLLPDSNFDLTDVSFDSLVEFFNYPKHLTLPYYINTLTFRFASQNGNLPHKIKYRSILKGYDQNWNQETANNTAKYSNLPAGTYTIEIQAKIENSNWGPSTYYSFKISAPFWELWWFRLLSIALGVFIIWLIFKWRNKQLIARQIILEKTVDERTREINEQKHLIEEKQKEIVDSINYAKRIQYALLASKKILDKNLNDYFIYFKPKDLVSGDFYWATNLTSGNFILVTADSTGHGVPGAIMSILNIACLTEAIKGDKLEEPADILNETRKKIIEHLANDGSKDGGKDGMDCSILCIHSTSKKLSYSAANNPIWLIRNNELITLSADRMPVGKHDKDNLPFTQKTIDLQMNDMIYTFTDGFPDQFGGPLGKKFKYKQLEELLRSISNLSLQEQKNILDTKFNEWKGELEQVDDVCIIGIRI